MSIADMMHYINVTENDSKSGWDKSALKKLIMLIYNHSLKEPSVSVNWDNPEDHFHYLLMNNVEEDPEPLEKTLPPRWRRFISEPFIDTSYAMLASTITHFGRHDIVLFHVQTDYVLLYQSSGQNSRDLNEPYNNINGGLGMFTAFNSDTVSIVLLPQK